MDTLYRAQLLLGAEQHRALAEMARQEGRSISDLVREIVQQHLDEKDREARNSTALQAIEKLTSIRTKLREERGIYQGDPLAEVRREWEEANEQVWRDES